MSLHRSCSEQDMGKVRLAGRAACGWAVAMLARATWLCTFTPDGQEQVFGCGTWGYVPNLRGMCIGVRAYHPLSIGIVLERYYLKLIE